MTATRALKLLHALGTAWFLLTAAYITVLSLRQAGVNWWVIFSLSGYSAASGFVLMSAYLFAIFRGNSRNQACSIEHPLSSSRQYMVLYSIVPLLGAFAGLLCKFGIETPEQAAGTIALGTLGATFGFWIVIDPAIALCEMLLPTSRNHRMARLREIRNLRLGQQKQRQEILELIDKQEMQNKEVWTAQFAEDAMALAQMAQEAKHRKKALPCRAVEIGLAAFRRGGLECMQVVNEMAIAAARKHGINGTTGLYISTWWDGIGHWRDLQSLCDDN